MNRSLTPEFCVRTPLLTLAVLLLASCGGGGGGGGGDDSGGAAAVSLTLSASPATITAGTWSTLTWSSSNAMACTASGGWSGSQSLSGSQATGNLAASTTYTLDCAGAGDSASQSATVTVTSDPQAPTVSLSASPVTVPSGSPATLTWSSTNATSCTASGGWSGSRPLSGSQATGNLAATTTYTLACTGSGGSASQSTTVTVTVGATGPFPLRVEPGKRYLIDAQGQPYFLNGDTAWALMVQLDLAGAEQYLEDRRLKGMNTVLIELIESTHGSNAPDNYAGQGPFLTPGDFSTPNEAYFAHAAAIISLAAAKGMLVLLTPAYLGYQGDYEGWLPIMTANGTTKLRNYGRYLGQRFAGYDNILWVHGGDYDPPAEGVALARAVAEGIRDIDTTRRWLHTFHADRNTSALDSAVGNEPWLTTDVIYTSDTNVVEEAYSTWNSASLPYFLYEAQYEDPDNGPRVRKQAYQALLSGAHGHVMGNDTVWRFKSGWQNSLDSEGARSMPAIKQLFTTRAWWLLVPDTGQTFLTAGINPGSNHAPAALASDRSFGLIYTPEVRQLTVNLARLAGPRVTARWFDPISATSSTVAGSPFTATGSRAFMPPGNNSAGAGDWVLVLDATP